MVVVGLEQHRSPLELLERVTVPEEALGKTLAALRDRSNLSEVVVLSTCLRTELYAVVERFHEGVADLQEFLATSAGTSVDVISEHQTLLFDDAVTVHLFEVASGLHSAVLGETEVLGQVRRAGERAEADKAAGPVLSSLFRRAVQVGRRVRSQTAIAQGATSLSHIAVEVAARGWGGSLADRRVLVVGAGEMGEAVVGAVSAQHPASIVVANRTAARAQALADAAGGSAIGLAEVSGAAADADVLLVSTGATLPVIDGELLGAALARRQADPLLPALVVVDLGVPRNVDPALSGAAGVELFDMDDLRTHAEKALEGRQAEVGAAQEIVAQELERFRADGRARGAAPIVSAMRSHIDALTRAELERHRARLSTLDDAQWHEVESVLHDVLAKLLHEPSVVLKEVAGTPRGERLTEALRALFDL